VPNFDKTGLGILGKQGMPITACSDHSTSYCRQENFVVCERNSGHGTVDSKVTFYAYE
jgi:hypothetical protein